MGLNNSVYNGKAKTSTIDVEARSNEGKLTLTVSDNGVGIPQSDHKKVLQRFYRLEQSRNMPGSGLGLALVNAIAKLHSASLQLHDNKPGLRVVLEFPLVGRSKNTT